MTEELLCRCMGSPTRQGQCKGTATQEDGLCDGCRGIGALFRLRGVEGATCCEDMPEDWPFQGEEKNG